MVGHVDPVIAIDQDKHAGQNKGNQFFCVAALFHHVSQHRQGEHHAGNGHVAAGPGFEVIVAARQIRNHLPPVAEFAFRIFQRNQILVPRTGGHLLEPEVHIVRSDARNENRRADRDQLVRIA